jgi:hypothetical protein
VKTKMMVLWLAISLSSGAKAQWVVTDPVNLVENVLTALQTSSTVSNVINNVRETVKIYDQAKEYYDALKSVHSLIKDAQKVQQTVAMIGDITNIYATNFNRMVNDPCFTYEEIEAISVGYAKLLGESNTLINELKTVTSSNGLSMSDAERMAFINRIHAEVRDYKNLVQYYTNKMIAVSYLRAKKANDTGRIFSLYGNPSERYW